MRNISWSLNSFKAPTFCLPASAGEARAYFTQQVPDVLVSDLRLPGEDGLQLIRHIRALDEAHGGRTPAAAFTALARSEDRARALNAGYQMHLTKPVDPLELAAAIARGDAATALPEERSG